MRSAAVRGKRIPLPGQDDAPRATHVERVHHVRLAQPRRERVVRVARVRFRVQRTVVGPDVRGVTPRPLTPSSSGLSYSRVSFSTFLALLP